MSDSSVILPLFDIELRNQRLRRAYRQQALLKRQKADFLLTYAAQELEERLDTLPVTFPCALALGYPGPHAAHILNRLQQNNKIQFFLHAAPIPEILSFSPPDLSISNAQPSGSSSPLTPSPVQEFAPRSLYEEALPHQKNHADLISADFPLPFAPHRFDLLVSLLGLQHTNDLPHLFKHFRTLIAEGGLFLAALIGGETLQELRFCLAQAEIDLYKGTRPHISPFATQQDLGLLLQNAGFIKCVTDKERLSVSYKNLFDLLHDLRAMGATNILSARHKSGLSRTLLIQTERIYRHLFPSPCEGLLAHFEILWLLGWAGT